MTIWLKFLNYGKSNEIRLNKCMFVQKLNKERNKEAYTKFVPLFYYPIGVLPQSQLHSHLEIFFLERPCSEPYEVAPSIDWFITYRLTRDFSPIFLLLIRTIHPSNDRVHARTYVPVSLSDGTRGPSGFISLIATWATYKRHEVSSNVIAILHRW